MKINKAFLIATLSAIVIGGAATYWFSRPSDNGVSVKELGGFAGTVVDGLTGVTLPATVTVASGGRSLAFQNCADDGVFDFDLDNGTYQFSAEYDGYVAKGKQDAVRKITIEEGTHFVNARLKLWPEAGLTGRIMAGERGIQANVRLTYIEDDSGATDYVFVNADTDPDGVFEFGGAYGGFVALDVEAEGFANLTLNDIFLKPGETTDLGEIPMRDGVSIYGNVLDQQTKQALGGVRVRALDVSNRAVLAETHSFAGGNYRLPVVDASRVFVTAELDGYRVFSADVRLAGTLNRQFDFVLKRAWGLVIQLSNETGREPADARVQVKDLRTQKLLYDETHSNGTFSLDGFKEGPYLVTATTMDGDTTYEVRAMAGDSVRLVLKPYAGFNVSVVKRDGTPVTQGEYRYLYQDSKGGSKYSTWESFSEATFDINDLREGHYRVEVRVSNDHVSSAPEVMLHNGEYRTLKIQLTEGGVLRGRVVSQMDGRGVRATIEGVGNSLKAATDADGNFVLDQLPDATFDLLIRPENGQEKIFPAIRVSENQEVERSFEVEVTARTRRPRPRGEMARGERGERPAPPWGDGAPPWGDGAPPWGDGAPPWGDGAPPWGDGAPPWGDGAPPWGDGAPPWGNGAPPTPEGNARTEPSVEPASATMQPQARDGEEASSSRRRGKNGRNWMGGRLSRTGIFKNKAESDAGNAEE